MITSRRNFLEMLGAVGGIAVVPKSVVAAAGVEMKLRIGVLSDIHLMRKGLKDETYVYGSDTIFRKALGYFRERRVDAVIIAGDMANTGRFEQLKLTADDWFEVFPDNKGIDGTPVEPFFVYGNHDVAKWDNKDTDDICMKDPAGAWKRAFGWDWSAIESKTVKGYRFLGAHWGHEKEIVPYLERHAEELNGAKPFFYVQHPHPKGTVVGWGSADDSVTAALAKFPNAVALSGHSHNPFARDDASVWQGAFTSLGTSALSYLDIPNCMDSHGLKDSAMPWANDLGREGMIIEVYDGFITLEQREMVDNEEIRDLRVVSVPPKKGPEDYSPESVKARTKVPEFPEGAVLKESRIQLASRSGVLQNQVELVFPAAIEGKNISRVIRYRIEVYEPGKEQAVFADYVLAPFFFKNSSRHPKEVFARFPVSKVPFMDGLEYRVYPEDCWGRSGRPLTV